MLLPSLSLSCASLTLGSSKLPRHGATAHHSVSHTHYSKATKFQFGVHRLTHWHSFTMPSVKFSAFKTLMAYAILGRTIADGAIEYLCRVCDTLRDNSYPTRFILKMWDRAVESHLYSTPCRLTPSAHLPAIATPGLHPYHSLKSHSKSSSSGLPTGYLSRGGWKRQSLFATWSVLDVLLNSGW